MSASLTHWPAETAPVKKIEALKMRGGYVIFVDAISVVWVKDREAAEKKIEYLSANYEDAALARDLSANR